MTDRPELPTQPALDDDFVDQLLDIEEGQRFEAKRIVGDKLTHALESVVAFANTEGGFLVLGIEDAEKASGRDRVYGIDEKPSNVDELRRLLTTRITPPIQPPGFLLIGCTLRDGKVGSVAFLQVYKSPGVHSIVADGTFVRMHKSNREIVAEEITDLAMARGQISAETLPANVTFDLLSTDYWRSYATKRKLTRELPKAMQHLGLAKLTAENVLRPTHAAVLLFAEEPGGLLATKSSVRVFHYKGSRIEHGANPNLQKPPVSFSGPLLTQINEAYAYILGELATGVQMGPLGFGIVQRYPARVIKEAITNAVIHRDYRLNADIQIRIFVDRIEVESPGTLPGIVTSKNIREIGSVTRNPLIVSNLREFPDPPNLDAGEGVRMMYQIMDTAGLYPPLYLTRATTRKEQVLVVLRNENRPSVWNQIVEFIDRQGSIANAEVRAIMKTDTLNASKILKRLVELGLLAVANPNGAKRYRRYELPEHDLADPLFSKGLGKQNSDSS